MTWQGYAQPFVLMAAVAVLAVGMGVYMHRVFEGRGTPLDVVLRPCEKAVYRVCGIDPDVEMRWTTYVFTLLTVNLVGFVLLFALLELQTFLPLNPAHQPPVPFWVAWNTAISFMTNTNWQNYGGETALSYLSQAWLVVQQVLSPVTGVCLFLAVVRGFTRQNAGTLGNFWRDFVRTLLWVGIPMAVVGAAVLIALGSPQNISAYTDVVTLQGGHQTIAQGPVATYTAASALGDNGGGFMNVNAAHPFAGPNPAALLFQLLLGFAVPAGLIYVFGKMVGDRRQSVAIFAAMTIMFLGGALLMYHAEATGSATLAAHGIHLASGANMEGKESRFGIGLSTLFNNSTTAISWGSVSASNDSMTAIGGLVPLFNMMIGEVIFGSWGAGMIGMLAYAVLAVFIAGLMVGRTPEYLGKKIGAYEVKMAALAMLVPSLVILVMTGLSVALPAGRSGIGNPGAHGLTEVLYAFASGVGNNGSAFGALSSASPWYSATVGIAMLLGRFAAIGPLSEHFAG